RQLGICVGTRNREEIHGGEARKHKRGGHRLSEALSGWVSAHYWIRASVEVLVETGRITGGAFVRIQRPEPPCVRIEVAITVVVGAEVTIVLLASEEEVIVQRRRTGGQQNPECIIRVGVRDGSVRNREETHASMAIIVVVLRRPSWGRVAPRLADRHQAIDIR